jgi:hypothetical protein
MARFQSEPIWRWSRRQLRWSDWTTWWSSACWPRKKSSIQIKEAGLRGLKCTNLSFDFTYRGFFGSLNNAFFKHNTVPIDCLHLHCWRPRSWNIRVFNFYFSFAATDDLAIFRKFDRKTNPSLSALCSLSAATGSAITRGTQRMLPWSKCWHHLSSSAAF